MATPSDFQLLNRYSGLREFAQQFESSQEMIEAIESQVENDPRMIQMRASMQRLRESNRQVQAMQDGPPAELERLKRFSRVLTQDNPEERGLTEVLLQGVRRQGISRSRCVTFMLGEISRDLQKLQTLVSR
jgi:hypothetical protein